jgi:ATP-dependent DNA helicase RecG
MDLDTPVSKLPNVGPFFLKKLKRLEIDTIEDLLLHIPFRYEHLGETKKISELAFGEITSIRGTVLECRNIRTRYGKNLTIAIINDGTASIQSVWFNQPFLVKTIKNGVSVGLAGKVGVFSHKPTLINPEYEVVSTAREKPIHTKGFIPVYPETAGLKSKWIRTRIRELLPTVLPKIKETLPEATLARNRLIAYRQAIWQIHSPSSANQADEARGRLAFDEFLLAHLKALERRDDWERRKKGIRIGVPQEKVLSIISGLPFQLTGAQQKTLKEILTDLDKNKPMNRLLQGDVGSGKTIVAAITAYATFLNGYQSSFMAPTEILAIQHFNTVRAILQPLGVKVEILTANKKSKERDFDILVGTHALISKGVIFKKLALVVIDEQHRFGVKQRELLRGKGTAPHVLTMTATPIPRSLALTFYGDLDISIIDEIPPDRKPVKTYLVPTSKRAKSYEFIRQKIVEGRQTFIIFPLIEPSETLASVKAAVKEYKRLKEDVFPEFSLGLLHGRIKIKEKEEVLDSFINKIHHILVSTPIVEVGIDIPNATIMMIEGAERFGLASLHQLRGRVGRGSDQAFCFLLTESNNKNVMERLSSLEKHHNGLKLAEIDLKIRGPGQIYGLAQSGFPEFKIGSLSNLKLVQATKKEAKTLFKQIKRGKLLTLKRKITKGSFVPQD